MRISWQVQYDEMEPRSIADDERDEIRELRWDLDVDPESYYTLEELREMKREVMEAIWIEKPMEDDDE